MNKNIALLSGIIAAEMVASSVTVQGHHGMASENVECVSVYGGTQDGSQFCEQIEADPMMNTKLDTENAEKTNDVNYSERAQAEMIKTFIDENLFIKGILTSGFEQDALHDDNANAVAIDALKAAMEDANSPEDISDALLKFYEAYKQSFLMLAVRYSECEMRDHSIDCIELIRILAKYDMVRKDEDGKTALMHAATIPYKDELIKCLMDEAGEKDNVGNSALIYAIRSDNVELAQRLFSSEKDICIERGVGDNKEIWTPLVFAAFFDRREIVEYVIAHGEVTKEEAMLAYKRSSGNANSVLKNFCEQQGFIEKESSEESNSAVKAYSDAISAIIKSLNGGGSYGEDLDKRARFYAYFSDETIENVLKLENIIQKYADTSMSDKDLQKAIYERTNGITLLMVAAAIGCTDAIKLLLEHERGMKDKQGFTALMHAAVVGDVDAISLLHKHEAMEENKAGETALMLAIKELNIAAIRILREDERNPSGVYSEKIRDLVRRQLKEMVDLDGGPDALIDVMYRDD